jgi:hypothetical protein
MVVEYLTETSLSMLASTNPIARQKNNVIIRVFPSRRC